MTAMTTYQDAAGNVRQLRATIASIAFLLARKAGIS